MSAESFIVFFGVAFDLPESAIEHLEDRSDARLTRARAGQLDHYWGRFSNDETPYTLLLGRKLGSFGVEGLSGGEWSAQRLGELDQEIRAKLRAAGFQEEPALIVKHHPHY